MLNITKKTNVIFLSTIIFFNIVLSIYYKFSYDLEMIIATIIVFYLLFTITYFLSKKPKLKIYYEISAAILGFTLLSNVFVLFSYLLSALNLPMVDNMFGHWDALLGFNWHNHQQEILKFPWFFDLLQTVYSFFMLQTPFLILLYCYNKSFDDLQKVIFSFMVTLFFSIIISISLPALGGYYYHLNLTHDMQYIIENYGKQNCDTNLWCDFFAIRNGSLRHLTMDFKGLMTFPSFHAAAATLMMLYFMRFKYLNIFTTILNLLIIYSAISIGWHHLSDIIAGTLLAFVVYYAVFYQQSIIQWWNVKASRISSPMPSSSQGY